MTANKLSVAVIGAGVGGMAVAGALRHAGFENVRIYEQASGLARIDSGIQITPNAMKVLRGIGLEAPLREIAYAPHSHLDRKWDTGEVMNELPTPESLYGAPYLCMRGADLHEALASVVPSDAVHRNRKLIGLAQAGNEVTLAFDEGTHASADLVIGADGVHSTVRDIILGPQKPLYKGRVVYRAVFPAALMNGHDIGPSRTRWWGPDRHIVIYYTRRDRSEIGFAASVPEPAAGMTRESWSAKGDVKELRAQYAGFHPDVRAVLDACVDCHKWTIFEREPLPTWSDGRVVLLGDACHPMTYLSQGAATAIEDAAILTRCLEAVAGDDIPGALKRYEAHRKPRASRIQAMSSDCAWMPSGEQDMSWLYGYDAWAVPLS